MTTLLGLASGLVMAGTSEVIVSNSSLPWWAVLLIAICPPIIGLVCDLITSLLKAKGWISGETKDKIDEAVDDIVSDVVEQITGKDGKEDDSEGTDESADAKEDGDGEDPDDGRTES